VPLEYVLASAIVGPQSKGFIGCPRDDAAFTTDGGDGQHWIGMTTKYTLTTTVSEKPDAHSVVV
jgi:hypothetical protein